MRNAHLIALVEEDLAHYRRGGLSLIGECERTNTPLHEALEQVRRNPLVRLLGLIARLRR